MGHLTEKFLHTANENIATEWEKIFAHCTSDNGLIFEIIKALKKHRFLNTDQGASSKHT